MKRAISLFISVALVFSTLLPSGTTLNSLTYAKQVEAPTAQDIYEMMSRLKDPSVPKIEKERLTAVIFVHQDVYRRGVVDKLVPADDLSVQAFLTSKNNLQKDVARRMNTNYRNQTGANLSEPIVPFPYNDIYSDDDLIVGTGSKGKQMESLYAESLDQVIRQRAGRPMSALDRSRLDVNGMAWNMTTEGGIDNFWNKEKYINPQSGQANIDKLTQNPDSLEIIKFDANGNMQVLRGKDAASSFVKSFNVEEMLDIPGIEKGLGTGAMSDYLRMANIHKIDFNKALTKDDIIQFIRNQKYSQRLTDVFGKVALEQNPELASRYRQFIEVSEAIRNQKTALDLARILEKAYGVKIIRNVGGKDVVNFESLSKAMLEHQQVQLGRALPDLFSAVSKNEAFKIVEWLKGQPAGSEARKKLRKQLALTYAPLDEKYVNSILADINKLDLDEANKVWLVKAIDEDSKMIRQYAQIVGMPTKEFARSLSLEGPSWKVVEWLEAADEKVKVFAHALDAQPGGKKFKDFLRSKTAKALNLDVMLEGTKQEKIMHWSILILAAGRAYGAAGDQESKWKAMGMALFEMIPFVSATLRFSELEYKEAFKELAMDIFPPLVLANIAVAALHYTASSARDSFTETVWDSLTREALQELNESDFEKTDTGYWRLKDRQSYLNYLEEVEPGFGHRIAKLAPMVSAQVDAFMDRNPQVQTNNAALYTLQWFEKFDEKALTKRYAGQFNLEELRRRVWEKGLLSQGQAKNVERVAASIILDNLRIRADIYKQVLDGFIDRIERRYNLLKGQTDRECEGGIIKSTLGIGNDLCGASAIISNAQLILKQIYEATKIKMKDSDWGIPKLDEGYRQRLEVMMNYKISGKTELLVRQDMQRIIDDFREFIRLLLIAVELEKELRVLQLSAYVYGGDESLEAAEEVMLGDEFRIGASARIHPKRAGLKWTLYYYLEDQSGDIKLLDKVSLNPQEFNPGTEGLWPIKAPEKKTFLHIKRAKIEPDFEKEGVYNIYPVIAFGNWGKDPVSQLGLYVLQNPLEAPELFKENMVAFSASPVTFSLVRPKIKASLASFMYKNETNPLKVYLEAPKYLKEDTFKAEFEAQGQPSPQVKPQKLDRISLNKEKPSSVDISMPEAAEEGIYVVKVKAIAKSIAEKFQPLPQFKEFQYIDTPNPQAPQAENIAQDLFGQATSLEKRAQELVDKAKEIKQALADQIKEFSEKYSQAIRELANIEKMVKGFKVSFQGVESNLEKLKRLVETADKDGKEASSIRNSIEKHLLACCEAVKSVMDAQGSPEAFNPLLEKAYSEYGKVRRTAEDFNDRVVKIKASLESAKALMEGLKKFKDKQEELKAAIKSEAESLDALQAGLDSFKNQVSEISGLKNDMAGIVQEAAAILEQAKSGAQDARVLKQLGRIVNSIKEKDNSIASFHKSAASLLKGPEGKFNTLKKRYDSLQGSSLAEIKNSLERDLFKEAGEYSKDVQATYDTVLIYKDVVDESSASANKCIAGVNNNTQGIVSRTDCSAYPGTRAQWDRQKNRVVCFCDPGHVWDKNKNKCITNKEYELTYYNCDKYPNAQLYWDEAAGKSKCVCKAGFEWNNAGTACRVESSIQVARANCSSYPGTSPVWDNSRETVQCHCPPGQNWDSLSNSCITPYQPPPQDYSQPQPVQENPPNLFEDLPYVEKPVITQEPPQVQGPDYTGGGIDNQPDSDGYYTSGTGKGAFYDKLRQQGLMKDPRGGATTGLSDVTVNKNQVTLSVWDNSTEDLDRVNIYLNGEIVVSDLTIRNQPHNFTLYLRPGSNTLTVKALNIGDPEIIKRLNLGLYNSAAVSISGVSAGKSSQSWKLGENQSASMTIECRQ